jgi:hypothetical protein
VVLIVLVIVCVVQAVWIASHYTAPELSKVVSQYPLGDGGMVYVVVDDSGGATVPFIYRYYLSTAFSNDSDVLEALRKQDNAFLVTRDGNAKVLIDENRVRISVNNSVYRFNSPVLLRRGEQSALVDIWLDARLDNPM